MLHRSLPTVLAAAILWSLAPIPASAEDSPTISTPWPDRFVTRVEALALLQTLNAELLSHDSATLTLDRWCASHRLGSPARVLAERDRSIDKRVTDAQREILRVSATEAVGYRRVRLRCGAHILSQADNWYVPGRLTADMNRQLETSDIAFGRAVQALKFSRHTRSATLLWHPLPEGWETSGVPLPVKDGPLDIPADVIEHQAVLSLPDGTPFSLVVETYRRDVLDFPLPKE